jgi:hypothetical protein
MELAQRIRLCADAEFVGALRTTSMAAATLTG